MATLSISLSGSGVVNGTKNYTVSDADIQRTLDWASFTYKAYIFNTFGPAPTNQQILLAWIQNQLIAPTVKGEQAFLQGPPVITVPPPVVFG
jgi:hypothetical protein